MIDFIVTTLTKWLLSLRYDIKINGLESISDSRKGVVFLPNHPALIEPVILYSYLRGEFAPKGFGDQDQVDRPLIRFFARRWGVRTIPSIAKYGPAAKKKTEKILDETVEGIRAGDNLLLWPAGRVYRSYLESLGANSAVEKIVEKCPDVRIVLVRTRGLWGSGFSWASGEEPKVLKVLGKGFLALLASGIFFAPHRKVTIEFYEPEDLPRDCDRNMFNRFLENYYNEDAVANTYVPYTIWEKGGIQVRPEPSRAILKGDYSSVTEATRKIVAKQLYGMTGVTKLNDEDFLAADLGMDSLARMDLLLWLEQEFGFRQADVDAMRTVGDVMLAACGEFVYLSPTGLKPMPPRWFKDQAWKRVDIPDGDTVAQIFLKQAARHPNKAIIADQLSGVKTYRDIIIACMVLKPTVESFEGDCVGIMLPASITADVFYLAVLFAGKTPVMVNWTSGVRNVKSALDTAGVRYVLTSKVLVDRIGMQGIDLSEISSSFVFAEELKGKISKAAKLKALLLGHIRWSSLYKAKVPETAVVLFTSGSETLPKAVALTHRNLIANIRAVLSVVKIYQNDKLVGFLPPFHSFGLTVTMLLPLCGAAQIVFHPNPTEAGKLAKLIEAYKVTILLGTPTFLGGIVRTADEEQLSSLRLAVTGAQRCPEKVYEGLRTKSRNAVILEGYGVTECSPIISLNEEDRPRHFTIGKVLPGLEYELVSPEDFKPVKKPGKGVLLVRGESVFGGYLDYDGKSPFVEVNEKRWYNTGDIVNVDSDGVLTFVGRLKRFVKLGGEMVSLPAIEQILSESFAGSEDEGPMLAVEAAGEERPELTLFTTLDIDLETANGKIREAGLSGLHSIRRVVKLDEIPLLGTGKTNYRALKQMLNEKS